MASIIISADQPEVGRKIAARVAEALDYELLGAAVLDAPAEKLKLKTEDLQQLLEDLPRPSKVARERLALIRQAVVERFLHDNIVCAGISAQLFLREVPHVLTGAMLSDLRALSNQLAVEKGISPKRARKMLEKSEKRRQARTVKMFDMDETNPANYDLVIMLNQIDADRATKIIAETATDRRFQPMTYSRKRVEDEVLANRVRVALVRKHPGVQVQATDGTAVLGFPRAEPRWRKKATAVKELVREIDGVEAVEVRRESGR